MTNWQDRYQRWNNFENLDSNLRNQLNGMVHNETEMEDAFYTGLQFGTGGIRGILGAGINRLNIYTIRQAVKGLSIYLEKNRVNVHDRGVVIAYDSRHMSREFAIECAKVLGVHGIKTHIFEELRPTPLLSFAVRYLGAAAGIVITASHNPPEYNGFKVYNEEGSQISLNEANEIIKHINEVNDELLVPVFTEKELMEKNLLTWINGEVDNAYLEQLLKISKLDNKKLAAEKDLKIVFTPLHGTALGLVEAGLKQLNLPHVYIVKEQAIPDPEFSTVELPNPEERQAFQLAMKLGKEVDADVLLATDPDADRLGVAVKDQDGSYVVLTGNQLGSLLLDYILSNSDAHLLKNARMLKTIVTTELGRAVANSYGVETVDTLTGFKYIGEKINEYDATGETFIFGFEESYGYLISSFARDKDAVQATVMACEMAQYWKDQGKTLIDALHNLYEKHGFYKEELHSFTLEGVEGQAQIKRITNNMRKNDLQTIGKMKVKYKEDYLVGKRFFADNERVEEILLPNENVIKYVLEDDSWLCVRPSGTEPKIKWYYGVRGNSEIEANEKLLEMSQALNRLMEIPTKNV